MPAAASGGSSGPAKRRRYSIESEAASIKFGKPEHTSTDTRVQLQQAIKQFDGHGSHADDARAGMYAKHGRNSQDFDTAHCQVPF